MKRALKIFGLIAIYFLACGKSCDNDEQFTARKEKEKVEAETKKLITEFKTDSLSAAMIKAFEETAVQRFYDYNDYVTIVSDTTKALQFRNEARKMISALFLPGTEPAKITRPYALFKVNVKKELQLLNDSVYSGRLAFTFVSRVKHLHSDDLIRDSAEIDVFLVKRSKEFGKEKLRVWDVFLGKME
jgi:hypothetical protein